MDIWEKDDTDGRLVRLDRVVAPRPGVTRLEAKESGAVVF